MANNIGNIRLALKAFKEDLQFDKDYCEFKKNAVVETYEDFVGYVLDINRDMRISVLKTKSITVNFYVPDIDTPETTSLNRKLLRKYYNNFLTIK